MNRKLVPSSTAITTSSSWMMICNNCIKKSVATTSTTVFNVKYNNDNGSYSNTSKRFMSIISRRGGNTGALSSGLDAKPSSKVRHEIQKKQYQLEQAAKMMDSLAKQNKDLSQSPASTTIRTRPIPSTKSQLSLPQGNNRTTTPIDDIINSSTEASSITPTITPNRTVSDIYERVKQLEKEPKQTRIKDAKAMTKETGGATEIKYSDNEELIFRLMINEMEMDRHSEEKIHELIINLPEYQDYNNEVLRCLNQIDMDYMALGDKEDSWIDNEFFEKRRNNEVEEIRKKHYRRVSDAVDKRLNEFNDELQAHIDGIIDMIRRHEGLTDEQIKNHPVHGYLFDDMNSDDRDVPSVTYHSKDSSLGDIVKGEEGQKAEEQEEPDDFQLALQQTLGLAPGENVDVSDIPEETQILFHKVMGTTYKRKEMKIDHEFSMEPLNFGSNNNIKQQQHHQNDNQNLLRQKPSSSSSSYFEEEDFNLKDILKGMKGSGVSK